MRGPSGDADAAILSLFMHYFVKFRLCLQSVVGFGTHFTAEPMTLRRAFSGLCRGKKKKMSVIAATLCGYFPVGFRQDFPSLCLLVITDLRLLQVQGRPSFMDIRPLPCPDL